MSAMEIPPASSFARPLALLLLRAALDAGPAGVLVGLASLRKARRPS